MKNGFKCIMILPKTCPCPLSDFAALTVLMGSSPMSMKWLAVAAPDSWKGTTPAATILFSAPT
jgi:hypothetical protein